MKHLTLAILGGLCAATAQAAAPAELLEGYRAEAVRKAAGYRPNAELGAHFYGRRFGVAARMPSCASCHTDDPARAGRHVVTDKAIKPLAPAANAARFTDPAKVEKWFRRNCVEVVGRECSAAEKADFIAWLLEVR